jgi:hypothetical protein
VISTIVNSLLDINKKYVLLAPTGRAAKFANKPAFTIQKIYFQRNWWRFTLQQNKTQKPYL